MQARPQFHDRPIDQRPRTCALARRGASIANAERQPAMVAKQVRKDEWQRIATWQTERINELTGMDVAIALTGATDAIIRTLVERAFAGAEVPSDWTEHAAVFALGGYGRWS